MTSRDRPNVVKVCAVALFNRDGEVLLVRKRNTSTFMFPGGKPELDEKLEDALIRECSEEIGVIFDESEISYRGHFVAEAANEEDTLVEADIWEGEWEGLPLPQSEIEQCTWWKPNELDNNGESIPIADLVRVVIEDHDRTHTRKDIR